MRKSLMLVRKREQRNSSLRIKDILTKLYAYYFLSSGEELLSSEDGMISSKSI